MNYRKSKRGLDTPKKILKVNHAGEFGAINIYRAQMIVCRWVMQRHIPMLQHFLEDETRHLNLYKQLEYLSNEEDGAAYAVVKSILEDEVNHRDTGFNRGGTNNLFYSPRFMVSTFTEGVIRFGMR